MRLRVLQSSNERRKILKVALDEFNEGQMGGDHFGLGVTLAFDKSVDLVSLIVKDLCQVLAVLAGDAGDQGSAQVGLSAFDVWNTESLRRRRTRRMYPCHLITYGLAIYEKDR